MKVTGEGIKKAAENADKPKTTIEDEVCDRFIVKRGPNQGMCRDYIEMLSGEVPSCKSIGAEGYCTKHAIVDRPERAARKLGLGVILEPTTYYTQRAGGTITEE